VKRKIEAQLLNWKSKKQRMPLLIKGARHVGKTYIVREFGKRYFKNTIYLDFETDRDAASFFGDDISPQKLLRRLESYTGQQIVPGETLVIFDEIQFCNRALTSLKYFCEDAPEYHIVAAGSLMGFPVNPEHYSFPVGRVEMLELHPLDFEEYLWARGKEPLANEIKQAYRDMSPLPENLHQEAVQLYNEYLIVGGMPASDTIFLETGDFSSVPAALSGITDSYTADIAKYASPIENSKIEVCYRSIPAQLVKGNKTFPHKVAQQNGDGTQLDTAIQWLSFAGMVLKNQRITQASEPLAAYADFSSFKLYLNDVGLLATKLGLSHQSILSGKCGISLDAIAENYVAQQFAAKGHSLYYWYNEDADVDFVLQKDNEIIGVAIVMSENDGKQTFDVFTRTYNTAYNIYLSTKNFSKYNGLKFIPLYAAFCI